MKRTQPKDGTESTALGKLLEEKHFGTGAFESDPEQKVQDNYEENDRENNYRRSRDIAKATDQSMDIEH